MKSLLKKIIIFIFIFIVLRGLMFHGINLYNLKKTDYIYSKDNKVIVNNNTLPNIHAISNVTLDSDDIDLTIGNSSDNDISLFINNLQYKHWIYSNKELVSQNVNNNNECYDGDYAYKILTLPANKTHHIQIRGKRAFDPDFYIGSLHDINDLVDVRMLIYSSTLLLLMILTIVCFVFYIINSNMKFFLVLVLMGVVSSIKTINLGELMVLTNAVGININNYPYIDFVTSLLNTFCIFAILVYLYEIKTKRQYSLPLITILLLFTIIMFILKRYYDFLFIIISAKYVIVLFINFHAFVEEKKYYKSIFAVNVLASSFLIYMILYTKGIYSGGVINLYINYAYLGTMINFIGFVSIYTVDFANTYRRLREKNMEFERISLLRGIGHDLKMPISIIKSSNQIIKKYDLSRDKMVKYIDASINSTNDLEEMANNINLFINNINMDGRDYNTSIILSMEKLRDKYEMYSQIKHYKFIVDIDDNDYNLKINPILFDRMLLNLVDNAFKYNKENGMVRVCYKLKDQIFISVEDSGIGIDEVQIDNILKPFYRVDASRSIVGMGLGLSVVQDVVKKLNGEIKIDSKLSVGTKFTVIIPK